MQFFYEKTEEIAFDKRSMKKNYIRLTVTSYHSKDIDVLHFNFLGVMFLAVETMIFYNYMNQYL